MSRTSKAFFCIVSFFSLSSAGRAASHGELISCRQWMGLDTACEARVGALEPAQPYLSTFNISYTMTCDPGIDAPKPSPLKVIVHNASGQSVEKTIMYKSSGESWGAIEGRGPVELVDTRPLELKTKRFRDRCTLSVNVLVQKSQSEIDAAAALLAKAQEFVDREAAEIDERFRLTLQYKADVLATENDRAAMACLIRRSDNDIVYEPVVNDMKTTFALIFRTTYAASFCTDVGAVRRIADDCRASDISRTCIYKNAYFKSRRSIEDTKKVLEAYLDDASMSSLHSSVEALLSRIKEQAATIGS